MAEDQLTREAVVAMVLFSLASSSLLLINKLCVHLLPAPSLISTAQFVSSTATAVVLMASGRVPADRFEWSKVRPYLLYVLMFVATIYSNMRALQHSNIETIIVFRACCPLVVCLIDAAFLGRALPSAGSVAALVVLVGGAVAYVLTDRAFLLGGWAAYSWVTAYFFIISVEMAYGKHIVGPHLSFASMWGPTMYSNTLSIPPMLAIGLMTAEPAKLAAAEWTPLAVGLLLLSCAVGVAISYLGWRARSLVSATCYTVLGVANKMMTVLVNVLIWDRHATPAGVLALCVCLGGASMYKQSPMRADARMHPREHATTPSAEAYADNKRCLAPAAHRRVCGLPAWALAAVVGVLGLSSVALRNDLPAASSTVAAGGGERFGTQLTRPLPRPLPQPRPPDAVGTADSARGRRTRS